jgi:hypothetical protein
MHLFLPPLQAAGHYVYPQCERQRVCVDVRMVCRCAVCFMSAVSYLPFYQFLLSPVLCKTPPDRAGVWSEGRQKTSPVGAIREGHSYSY